MSAPAAPRQVPPPRSSTSTTGSSAPERLEPRPYTPGLDPLDRLYDLLPAYIRASDLTRDQPLRGLLRVLAEPLLIVEEDVARLYENWFIETCDAWAIPYVAAPVGYRTLPEPSVDGLADLDSARARLRLAGLAPRRDAANTLAHRRRKGTLAVFQQLANDLTGWPARAVEFRDRTATFQNLNSLHPERGRTIDVRHGDEVDRGLGPFSSVSRTVDLRSAGPDPWWGRGRVGDLGLYVWPLRIKRVVRAPAHRLLHPPHTQSCGNDETRYSYTFSALGNRTPLYHRPLLPHDPARIAGEAEIASPIRLEAFRAYPERYYGADRSLRVWKRDRPGAPLEEVPLARIVPADLKGSVAPKPQQDYLVAVDPAHGLLTLAYRTPPADPRTAPELTVSYRYGAPGNLGGGDYYRPLTTGLADRGTPAVPSGCDAEVKPCRVFVRTPRDDAGPARPSGTRDDPYASLADAIERAWNGGARVPGLVIEILDDGLYALGPEPVQIGLGDRLEILAAQGRQPILTSDAPPAGRLRFLATGSEGGTLVLDGLLILGAKLVVEGPFRGVAIRHCTLVPGLALALHGDPLEESKNSPSLVLRNLGGPLSIDRSIVGSIVVRPREAVGDAAQSGPTWACPDEPPRITVTDSILDNAGSHCPALGGKTTCAYACARLRVERSTVFGPVNVHAIERAQDSLFVGPVHVARRRLGCMRFCYVPEGSTTPARYHCQPDLARAGSGKPASCGPDPTGGGASRCAANEATVIPRFRSERYGDPDYALLAPDAPPELTRGSEDLAEMGAFHDESLALRQANLGSRVDEYTPADADVQIIEVFE